MDLRGRVEGKGAECLQLRRLGCLVGVEEVEEVEVVEGEGVEGNPRFLLRRSAELQEGSGS